MSVLLVTVDCLRADHVGIYGYNRPTTPNIDALAGSGVALQGFANSPGTRWALQTIHSGAYQGQFDGVGLPKDSRVSLAQSFSAAGYATGGFAFNGFLTRDYNYHQGFDTFKDVSDFQDNRIEGLKNNVRRWAPDRVVNGILAPLYRRFLSGTEDNQYRPATTDQDVTSEAIDWIEAQTEEWFAWVHLMDAHTPYARWNKHLRKLRGDTDVEHVVAPEIDVGETPDQAVIDAYDSGIRSADQQIGRLLDTVPADTTVLVTGDHGEEFGHYGSFHSASLYSSMTQVPFVLSTPRLEFDKRGFVSAYAQHVDIAPTVADASDLEVEPHWVGGSVLSPPREDREIWHHVADNVGTRIGPYKLIESENGENRAYFRTDYGVEDKKTESDVPAEMRRRLEESVASYREFCVENKIGEAMVTDIGDAEISSTVQSNLKDLGYVE